MVDGASDGRHDIGGALAARLRVEDCGENIVAYDTRDAADDGDRTVEGEEGGKGEDCIRQKKRLAKGTRGSNGKGVTSRPTVAGYMRRGGHAGVVQLLSGVLSLALALLAGC